MVKIYEMRMVVDLDKLHLNKNVIELADIASA